MSYDGDILNFHLLSLPVLLFFIKLGNLDNLSHRTLYNYSFLIYIRTKFILIKWDSEPSGYAENPDNLIFLKKKIGYIGSLNRKEILQIALCG